MKNFLTMVLLLVSFSFVFASTAGDKDVGEQVTKQKTELQVQVGVMVPAVAYEMQSQDLSIKSELATESLNEVETVFIQTQRLGYQDFRINSRQSQKPYNYKEAFLNSSHVAVRNWTNINIQRGNNYLSCRLTC